VEESRLGDEACIIESFLSEEGARGGSLSDRVDFGCSETLKPTLQSGHVDFRSL
jgi:hypothetical protein